MECQCPARARRTGKLPELDALERIIELGAGWLESRVVCDVVTAELLSRDFSLAVAWAHAHPQEVVAAAVFRAPVVKPLASTLVLASEQDHLVSVECSRTLARHWQCALRLHPNAGHDLPLDDGPWVAAQVRDWLIERVPLKQRD